MHAAGHCSVRAQQAVMVIATDIKRLVMCLKRLLGGQPLHADGRLQPAVHACGTAQCGMPQPLYIIFLCFGMQRNDSTVPEGEAAFVDEALQGAEAASPRVSRRYFMLP